MKIFSIHPVLLVGIVRKQAVSYDIVEDIISISSQRESSAHTTNMMAVIRVVVEGIRGSNSEVVEANFATSF
jgi:hypothetical protein